MSTKTASNNGAPVTTAWCLYTITSPPAARAFLLPSPPHKRILPRTRRRPRSLRLSRTSFACQFPSNPATSSELPFDEDSAAPSSADSDSSADDAHSNTAQFGLLTDSVLEVKWKNEKQHPKPEVPATFSSSKPFPVTPSSPPCSCDDAFSDDLSASDPYKAFANFTRIAAPTALLGREEPDNVFNLKAHDNSALAIQHRHMPYSSSSIAHRLMRYTYAKQNLADFMSFFQGEFDNYDQIASQRRMGMGPREGGGHEHIHCSITPVSSELLFARYYFNGDPSIVFRSRLYHVTVSDSSDRGIVEMRIFRFYEETEQRLKAHNYDVNAIEWDDGDVYDWLEGCEVFWERYEARPDEEDSAGKQLGIEPGPRFVGYMKGGGCELYSREIGGRIKVMDDLLLTSEDLWVADRGFDDQSNFVYGNRRGVPYKMRRVRPDDANAWTLSSTASPPEGYIA